MQYRFTAERENYEVYASGSVLVAAPGHPSFPVRLANEIFRRGMAYRARWGAENRCVLYDPCCGGAYHLTTLAYFNWQQIELIYASDIDPDALSIARRNLALLEPSGLDRRTDEIAAMAAAYGKESHATALANAAFLKAQLTELRSTHTIATQVFQADATDTNALAGTITHGSVDMVIADVPYGKESNWVTQPDEDNTPTGAMLSALLPLLDTRAVIAVSTTKQDKVRHSAYQRLEKFNVGKRQITLLRPQQA